MIRMTLVTSLKDQHQARTLLMTFRLLLNHLPSLEVCQAANFAISNFATPFREFSKSQVNTASFLLLIMKGLGSNRKCCVALLGD